MSAFAGGAPFGNMSVADLGSLTRLEVTGKNSCWSLYKFRIKFAFCKKTWNQKENLEIELKFSYF